MLLVKKCGLEGKSIIIIGKERMDVGEELVVCIIKIKEVGVYS